MEFMQQHSERAYAVLRIASGFVFFWHGTQKLLGFPRWRAGGGSGVRGLRRGSD